MYVKFSLASFAKEGLFKMAMHFDPENDRPISSILLWVLQDALASHDIGYNVAVKSGTLEIFL